MPISIGISKVFDDKDVVRSSQKVTKRRWKQVNDIMILRLRLSLVVA